MYVHMYTYMYIYIYTCVDRYIYICIIHTHIVSLYIICSVIAITDINDMIIYTYFKSGRNCVMELWHAEVLPVS